MSTTLPDDMVVSSVQTVGEFCNVDADHVFYLEATNKCKERVHDLQKKEFDNWIIMYSKTSTKDHFNITNTLILQTPQ